MPRCRLFFWYKHRAHPSLHFNPTESIEVANRGPVRSKNSYKRLKYAQNKESFDILSYTFRWTGQEIAWLYFCQIREIKRIRKRTPFRGATPVYTQKTVDAYWDELMDRMPEGREPEYKQVDL